MGNKETNNQKNSASSIKQLNISGVQYAPEIIRQVQECHKIAT